MSGIVNRIGAKSGIIKRKEPSVIRWRLNGDPGANAQDPLGSTADWIVSDGVSENPVEFATGYFGSPTLVTEASGIFSFTETGYYYISSLVATQQFAANTLWIRCYHKLSNNGSGGTYSFTSSSFSSQNDSEYSHIPVQSLVKVDDIANDHFKLVVDRATANPEWLYSATAGENLTYIDFIKLGGL